MTSSAPAGEAASWTEELVSQRDAALQLAQQLGQELAGKLAVVHGRLDNAKKLRAEAEGRLGRVRREYHSKHLTLRKQVLRVAGTLALASFGSWVLCGALAASSRMESTTGVLMVFPVSVLLACVLFSTMHSEGVKLLIPVWLEQRLEQPPPPKP